MNTARLRRLHRIVGLIVSPFVLLQTLSGLFLGFGIFRRDAPAAGPVFIPQGMGVEQFLIELHFGRSWYSDLYHLMLGAGILWMVVSGWMLYLRLRRARNRRPSP